MKRLHVHVAVADLDQSIRFYATLFGAEPSVRKDDYAKWMLDDPRVNFAISQRGAALGLDHLGLQTENAAELAEVGARFGAAGAVKLNEQGATCCYARSDKYWAEDPQGVRWESFYTHGEATTYSGAPASDTSEGSACCVPAGKSDSPARCCG
jgi:catechol 2,3-dioxygenase-like lactoylglutathione lyase family enzyme